MTITYVAAGTTATGTTSATVAHPAGLASGDLEIMQLITGHPTALKPSVPAGWSKFGEFSGGDPAAYGSNTGPRRLTILTRTADATNPQPTITMPAGTNVFIAAVIYAFRGTLGHGWRFATTFGEDNTTGTTVSVVGSQTVTWHANDFLLELFAVPLSTATVSAEAITATGVTVGTVTERTDAAAGVGANARIVAATASVTSVTGSPNVAPTLTSTLSSTNFAVGALVRIREATAVMTATVQSAFPPRVLVVVSGMLNEDIISIDVQRSALDTLTDLRTAVGVDVTGKDAFVRTDGEQPFGVPVSYAAVLHDVEGDGWIITSNSVTTDVAHEVVSDAVLGVGVGVQIRDWRERKYERESSTFNVAGRLVVVSGPNPGATSDLILFTESTADRNAMLDLLNRATNGIIQIRTEATTICEPDEGFDQHAQIDSYLAVIETVLERAGRFRHPQRDWQLSVAEVGAWPSNLEARGWTYADIDGFYDGSSYAAVDTSFTAQTYLALDTKDWGV